MVERCRPERTHESWCPTRINRKERHLTGVPECNYPTEEGKLMPNAKRILFTAYADTAAAVSVRLYGLGRRFRAWRGLKPEP